MTSTANSITAPTNGLKRQYPNHIYIPEVKKFIDQGENVVIPLRGYSMRLFLEHDRDKVILTPVNRELHVRDVVLAEVSPQCYVLHRIIRIEGDTITLMGDGNVKGTETCHTQDVIALAIAFYRKGRTTPDRVESWKWRTYSRIWLAIKPFRRIILGIYRRLPFRI